MQHNNRYIVTGGPGFGKSTLVNTLYKEHNYLISTEAARSQINISRKNNLNIFPWKNRDMFDALLLLQMRKDYLINNQFPVIYDGAILDIIAWRSYLGLDYSEYTEYIEAYRYENIVFFLAEWKAIYLKDDDRPFSFSEAVKINNYIRSVYQKYGYKIVTVPIGTPIHRARYVNKFI